MNTAVPATQPSTPLAAAEGADARTAALHRENRHRARAFDAERRGDFDAAAGHRRQARAALADRLDLPDPAVDEVGLRLDRWADAFHLAEQMEQHYRLGGDPEAAEGWRRDMGAAQVEARRLKETLADNLLKMLRFADELFPDALAAVLAETHAVRDLAERVAMLEAAVVRLAGGRAVAA